MIQSIINSIYMAGSQEITFFKHRSFCSLDLEGLEIFEASVFIL